MIKIALMIVLSVIALVLIIVGLGFFISSLYLYLVTAFHNSTLATFFCGVAIILIAILLLLVVILIKSSLFKFKPKTLPATIQEIAENPGDQALELVKKYPFQSAGIALGSGILLGFFPKLRNSLIDGVATYLSTGSVAESLKAMKSDSEE